MKRLILALVLLVPVPAASANLNCLPGQLKQTLHTLKRYGDVSVISTQRKNARVAGTKRASKHAKCQAVDLRIVGKKDQAIRWLKTLPLDVITYSGSKNHIHLGYGGRHRQHIHVKRK